MRRVSLKTWDLSFILGKRLLYLGLHSERFPDDKLLTSGRVSKVIHDTSAVAIRAVFSLASRAQLDRAAT